MQLKPVETGLLIPSLLFAGGVDNPAASSRFPSDVVSELVKRTALGW